MEETPNKIVMMGHSGVGKSSLLYRWKNGVFNENESPTIGAAFMAKKVSLGKETVTLSVWDTAGQERYHCLVPVYLRGATIVLLCSDIMEVEDIQQQIEKITSLNTEAKIVLVVTKTDLNTFSNSLDSVEQTLILQSKINYYKIKELSDEREYDLYMTSARTGAGIDELFKGVAKMLSKTESPKETVILSESSKNKIRFKCCY